MKKKLFDLFARRRDDGLHTQALAWLRRNWSKVDALFKDERLGAYVFEPVAELWRRTEPDTDSRIRQIISQIAIANAVLAGLPGRLGVGVVVAMALEMYMAVQIARHVGVRIERPADVLKYFGAATAVAYTVLIGFRHVLGFFFSFFSMVGFLPATALAELFATSLIGVVFWIGFVEVRENGAFTVPRRLSKTAWKTTGDLVRYQWGLVKRSFSPSTYLETGRRLKDWFTGEGVPGAARLRGDLFVSVAFVHLLAGRVDQLQGPLGETFMQALRDTNGHLAEASDREIAEILSDRLGGGLGRIDPDKLQGMESLVRGRMFELLVERSESWNGEGWEDRPQQGRLHEDFSHPGSDIVFTDLETGETIEVQIKATADEGYIEETLLRYPDTPIIVTSELGEEFEAVDMVQASVVGNEGLRRVTDENFEELLERVTPASSVDVVSAAGVGGGAALVSAIWPFLAAYIRGRIDGQRFRHAVETILPRSGSAFARRLLLAAAIGPLYAWWVLATSVMRFVPDEETAGDAPQVSTRRLVVE
ncbi:hypothetical protein [Rhodovulum sp. YNF3179]|uniref:hypothetical protein n=1 Tax=Rhodovulum sp. YNF3179 TaxID=3425127 RepID=UPI003D326139